MAISDTQDIIVIGGSAGSSGPLRQLLAALPADLPASVFVSTHIPSHAPSLLADILAGGAALPVAQALDGQPIQRGRVYVAAPDRHLLLIDGTVKLGVGPRENMSRPSIDPFFRSAAMSYGPRVIGVLLSGMLNDGAAGLRAIKSQGGTAVVQHPMDAEADQMPLSALEAVNVDHVASAADLGRLLASLAGNPAGAAGPADDVLALEVDIAAGSRLGSGRLRQVASPSPLSCPDCSGVLSEMNDPPLRYRCQIGHAYSAETLVAQIDQVDEAIRVAMRMMEERVTLVERMATDAIQTGRSAVAELYEARAKEYRSYAATLREAAITSLRLGGAPREQDI
jgi:two-component system chemotaxis response regulator CheB